MKIISISDVITNSSSEVFCVFDKYTFDRIKKTVNKILESFNVDSKFDDLFELVPEYDEYVLEDIPELTLEEAVSHDNECEGSPYIIGYDIISKTEKYEKLAKALSNLHNVFTYETFYC